MSPEELKKAREQFVKDYPDTQKFFDTQIAKCEDCGEVLKYQALWGVEHLEKYPSHKHFSVKPRDILI